MLLLTELASAFLACWVVVVDSTSGFFILGILKLPKGVDDLLPELLDDSLVEESEEEEEDFGLTVACEASILGALLGSFL